MLVIVISETFSKLQFNSISIHLELYVQGTVLSDGKILHKYKILLLIGNYLAEFQIMIMRYS